MLTYNQSDVFEAFNRGSGITNKLKQCLSKINDDTIMNTKIDKTFTDMLRGYKTSITQKIVDAARRRDILIVRLPIDNSGDFRFPQIIPFVKVKRQGKECVVVDISRISSEELGDDNEVLGYKVDLPKLYVYMISAYISLEICGANMVMPAVAAKTMAIFFADIFNQVLARLGLLTSNRDRATAMRYFAMKFYLKYYLQAPDAMVESNALSEISGTKNSIILFMEDQINNRQIDPFINFTSFSEMIYNQEISGIRTQQAKVNSINQSIYLEKFINMYSKPAIISLWSPDYFFFVLLNAYRRTGVVFDRAYEDIFKSSSRNMNILLDSLYKELS